MQVAVAALLLLLLLPLLLAPSAVAQPTPITDGNIKPAVHFWTADPTTAAASYGDIRSWNVAAVTSMGNLFSGKPAFNADISAWNVAFGGEHVLDVRGCEWVKQCVV
jgi:hypothetical protein